MKIFKKIAIVIAVLPLLNIVVCSTLSPPWAGKRIAREKGYKRPMVIAHRGASYLAPELTIPAFSLARDLGSDYVETDIQRTKDGVLINFHDDTLERTTNVASVFPNRIKEPVGSFTYTELKKLDAGSWYNKKFPDRAKEGFAGAIIPTMEEYVLACTSRVNFPGLLIELKNPSKYPGIEADIVRLLRKMGWLNEKNNVVIKNVDTSQNADIIVGLGKKRVIFQSFDEKSLAILKSIAPDVPRNYLVDEEKEEEKGDFQSLLDIAESLNAEIGPSGYLAYPWYVGAAHRRNKFFFVYTINKQYHFYLFSYFGVDGIITDRCDKYAKFLGRDLPRGPGELLDQYK